MNVKAYKIWGLQKILDDSENSKSFGEDCYFGWSSYEKTKTLINYMLIGASHEPKCFIELVETSASIDRLEILY